MNISENTQEIMLNLSRNSKNNICRFCFCVRTNLCVCYFPIRFLETQISSQKSDEHISRYFYHQTYLLFRCSIVTSRTVRRRSTWRWRPAIGESRPLRMCAPSPSQSRMSMTIRQSLTEQTTRYSCLRWESTQIFYRSFLFMLDLVSTYS